MKYLTSIFASFMLATGVIAVETSGADAETLKFAHFATTDDPNHAAALEFKEKIEKLTDGRYEIEIFENNKLGGEIEVVEAIALGTIDVSPPSAAALANVIPEMNILNMPFLFKDWDGYSEVLNGPFYDALAEVSAKKGFRVLGFMTTGPRNLMTKFPVNSMADLKGRKIRTVQNPVHVATFNAFGANATAVAYPEVYGALQTGVVDGGDAANTNYYTQKFYEVAPHWALLGWLYYTNPIVMSEEKFQSLSDADKQIFLQVGREVGKNHLVAWRASDGALLDKLKEQGVEVTMPDPAPFIAAAGPVYEEFLKTDFERDWLARMLGQK